jgi:hypothetical protein
VSSFASRVVAARPGRWLAVALAGGVAVVVVVLVAVGRWERQRWIDEQVRGMRHVQALVGPLDQPRLYGYRVLPQFDCLVYRRGGVNLALELCVDGTGRLVEAIDRLGPVWRYYSLRAEPGAATIHVDRGLVDRLLRKMGAPPRS